MIKTQIGISPPPGQNDRVAKRIYCQFCSQSVEYWTDPADGQQGTQDCRYGIPDRYCPLTRLKRRRNHAQTTE